MLGLSGIIIGIYMGYLAFSAWKKQQSQYQRPTDEDIRSAREAEERENA